MADDLLPDILALARRFAEKDSVGPDSRLFSDLGLDGDDAYEFMVAFAAKYKVDLSEFHWLHYFGDEGIDPFKPVVETIARLVNPSIRRRWRAASEAEREITIEHLARVAAEGRWIEPATRRVAAKFNAFGFLFFGIIVPPAVLMLFVWPLMLAWILADAISSGNFSIIAEEPGFVGGLGLATLFMTLLLWASWRNLQRKLASVARCCRAPPIGGAVTRQRD